MSSAAAFVNDSRAARGFTRGRYQYIIEAANTRNQITKGVTA